MFSEATTQLVDSAHAHGLFEVLKRSTTRNPDAPALTFHDTTWTYTELLRKVEALSSGLSHAGLSQGERVALFGYNSGEYALVCLALARMGAIAVPINFMLGATEVAYILRDSGASAVIVQNSLRPVMEAASEEASCSGSDHLAPLDVPTHLRFVMEAGSDSQPGWRNLAEVQQVDPADILPPADVTDDDVIQLMYTSGTESRPKGTLMTSASLQAQYMSCIVDGRMQRNDVVLHALPLFHVAAQHCFLMPYLALGAHNIIIEAPEAQTMLAMVERHRVTSTFCPPTVWISLLRHANFDSYDLSSLVRGYYGASMMPAEIVRELASRLPAAQLFNFYGQTEMSAVALVLPPEDQLRKAGSAGRAVLNSETILLAADGQPARVGEVGEIVHRSPHATIGYWNNEAKTAEAFDGGWFHSGDLGVMDEEGYITVVDRKKDMIKTGGENVASREVEEALYAHDTVAEVAVFGVPHEHWMEAVVAVVVPRADDIVTADELIDFAHEHLAGYKVPKSIVLTAALPKNASGKILKRALRDEHAHMFADASAPAARLGS